MNMNKNKKAETWRSGCETSLNTAHRALTLLYDGLEADCNEKNSGLATSSPAPFPSPETLSIPRACKAFTQHCNDLCSRLSHPIEGRVRLPLGALLKLVLRCLHVTSKDVRSIPSLQELSDVLPSVHCLALNLLARLILCCGTNLLPKSRVILDTCLQVLTSTESMKDDGKAEVRTSVYGVLSLWLETAGLSSHYLNQARHFHRELMADVQLKEASVQAPNGVPHKDATSLEAKRKKAKGKGKGSRRAESYLESSYAAGTPGVVEGVATHCVDLTVAALHVSKLVAERAQFAPLQALTRTLIDTASAVQRQDLQTLWQYKDARCRAALYQAVFAVASIPLELEPNSLDTLAHFQLTSRALHLVLNAGFSDPSATVRQICQNLVSTSRTIGAVNRPIVRKVLPDEQIETRDVGEMDRQMEELTEENERLKSQVLAGEVESQRQTRVVGELREELERLRQALVEEPAYDASANSQQSADAINSIPPQDLSESSSDEEEEEEEEERMDTPTASTPKVAPDHHKSPPTAARLDETRPDSSETKIRKDLRQEEWKEGKKGQKGKKEKGEKDFGMDSGRVRSSDVGPKVASEKRPGSALCGEEDTAQEKRPRHGSEEASTDVQAMLMDFVDAEPDSE